MSTPDRPAWAMEAASLIMEKCIPNVRKFHTFPKTCDEAADIILAACPVAINAELVAVCHAALEHGGNARWIENSASFYLFSGEASGIERDLHDTLRAALAKVPREAVST